MKVTKNILRALFTESGSGKSFTYSDPGSLTVFTVPNALATGILDGEIASVDLTEVSDMEAPTSIFTKLARPAVDTIVETNAEDQIARAKLLAEKAKEVDIAGVEVLRAMGVRF